MVSEHHPATTSGLPGAVPALLAGAVAALVGFRLGAFAGGWMGADVALALAGWWLASPGSRDARADRVRDAWQLAWPAIVAAIAVAVAWVLLNERTGLDAVVRGEALAAFGGYGNWHQISLGPIEALPTRNRSPLQHLWVWAVAVQCTLVWWAVAAVARRAAARRAARAGTEADPAGVAAVAALVLAGACALAAIALAATGASSQVLLLSTPTRATAFLLGAALGAGAGSSVGRAVAGAAHDLRHPILIGLGVLVVVAGPTIPLGRWVGVALSPVLAGLAVAAASAAPPGGALTSWATDRTELGARFDVALVVAVGFLATPVAATMVVLWPDAAAWVWAAPTLLVAGSLSVALAAVVARFTDWPPAVERRRVLAPPAVVGLLVVLWAVTGAFHWEAPQPREQWPAPAVAPLRCPAPVAAQPVGSPCRP